MSTLFWLTDENSDIQGYKRLKMEARSDCPSMVRFSVLTAAGPSEGIDMGAWVSDPLSGTDLTTGNWQFQIWGKQNSENANASLGFMVTRFTASAGEADIAIDSPGDAALATQPRSSGRSQAATAVTLEPGDRLCLRVFADDAASVSMGDGYQVTLSYNGLRAQSEGDSYIVCPDSLQLTAQYPERMRTAVRQMIQDVSQTNPNLKDQSVDLAITLAMHDYSRDRPFIETESLSGDGESRSFAMPRRWVYGLSSITEIEYPVNSEATTRTILSDDDWEILEGVLGMQPTRSLRFMSVPASGTDNIMVRYTTRHLHTNDESTVPAQDLDAIVCLGAAYCCVQLAANAAAHTAPTITADSVGRDSASQWQSIAKDLRSRYVDQVLGGGEGAPIGAASVTKDWDIESGIPGLYLFHPARWR